MNKKCVLLLDEFGQPIEMVEVKEYSSKELEVVIKHCEENKIKHDERIKLEKQLLLKELELKDLQIAELNQRVKECERNIKLLLGEE